ncbi:hypothetical protein [Candidatus Electronema sp. JM]
MASHHEEPLTNILTSPGVDEIALTPERKACLCRRKEAILSACSL